MAWAIRRREYDQHTEQVHAAGGASLRDLMLGLNDGLVASFAVTSGVAAAFASSGVVVMAGLAETLGGAVSMGLAAFISARSQLEFYQSEIQRERDEIRKWPEREREEIRAIYRHKGFAGALLDQIVAHITADPERWSSVMMREELGFDAEHFDIPLKSALTVGASYAVGASILVIPYLALSARVGLVASVGATLIALFSVGAIETIITSRAWWRSGLESLLTGAAAGAVTYGAGWFFGTKF